MLARRLTRIAGLVGVVALMGATPRPADARATAIPLVVTNDNFYDVHVYGWRNGTYESLGTVGSFSTEKLEVPAYLASPGGDFRVIADPIGGMGVYASEPIVVAPDQELVLTVRSSLNLSTVVVRPAS